MGKENMYGSLVVAVKGKFTIFICTEMVSQQAHLYLSTYIIDVCETMDASTSTCAKST